MPTPELYISGWWNRFDPKSVPNIALDLDSRFNVYNSISPNIKANNGDNVRSWQDNSGNGRVYDQTVLSAQPIYYVSNFNGVPSLSFNGINQYLINAVENIASNQGGLTFFIVHNYLLNTQQDVYAVSNLSGTFKAGFQYVPGFTMRFAGRRLESDSAQVLSYGNLNTKKLIVNTIVDYLGAKLTNYVNGLYFSTLNPFQTPGYSSNTSGIGTIGRNGTLAQDFLGGNVARILVYQRALSSIELNLVNTYLKKLYKIT
jgi:hypothetical protein